MRRSILRFGKLWRTRASACFAKGWRSIALPVVLDAPVGRDRVRSLAAPFFVPAQFFKGFRQKELLPIWGRMPERLL
jgi:hypothetical protein